MEKKLLIVIPTYNERDNIRPLSQEILMIVPEAKILFVDDNSPDGTGAVAEELTKQFPNIFVLQRKKKDGLGKAYIDGFREALKFNPEYIIQMDADFSHNPHYIPEFLKKIESCDLVIGSRFLSIRRRSRNITFFSVLANWYTKRILGIDFSDYLGGFKCFRRSLLEKIELGQFISKGFIFQAEFLFRAHKKGFRIREIPIYFFPRKSGKTKKSIRIIVEAFLKILSIPAHYEHS